MIRCGNVRAGHHISPPMQYPVGAVNLCDMLSTGNIEGTSRTILGIDPGTATMGWGVIRETGSRLAYVQHGAITTPPDWEMPRRLDRLFRGVSQLAAGYRPDAVAVEELFFNTNVTTAITVGQARGVALLAAYRAGCEVSEYTPLQVKQAITSYGRADKKQVQEMVKALLSLPEIPKPDDAADGLAIAITHAFSSRMGGHQTGTHKPRSGKAGGKAGVGK